MEGLVKGDGSRNMEQELFQIGKAAYFRVIHHSE